MACTYLLKIIIICLFVWDMAQTCGIDTLYDMLKIKKKIFWWTKFTSEVNSSNDRHSQWPWVNHWIQDWETEVPLESTHSVVAEQIIES